MELKHVWVSPPKCNGPCPMRMSMTGEQVLWECCKCGALMKQELQDTEEPGPPASSPARSDEAVKALCRSSTADSFGCSVVLLGGFVLLGWIAYLILR